MLDLEINLVVHLQSKDIPVINPQNASRSKPIDIPAIRNEYDRPKMKSKSYKY